MSAVIYTNQASLLAQKGLLGAQTSLANSVERLSSGLRINRAKDDAAGLGVGENLQKQLNGAKQGLLNLNDAISMSQTAEGALSAVAAVAQRMITLATQGANDTMSQEQRKSIAFEIDKLRTSIQDMGKRTKYTDTVLFASKEMFIQASNNAADRITVNQEALAGVSVDTDYTRAVSPEITLSGATIANGVITTTNSQLAVGQTVFGNNIPPGTTISSISSALVNSVTTYTVTLSNATLNIATPTNLTFKWSGNLIGSNVMTMTSVDSFATGQTIWGVGIPDGTTIVGVDTINKKVTLSNALTENASGNYTANIGGARTSTSGSALSTSITALMGAIGTSTGMNSQHFRDIQANAATYLNTITSQRGELGAIQNQLEFTISNLTEFSNNLAASRSRVMDTDYAAETANLTKGQILQQASTAMLAQANQMPNVILSLLK